MGLYADEQREIAACEATGPAVENGVDGVRVVRRQREHARGDLGHLPVPLPPVALQAEAVPRRERRGADAVHLGADPATAAVEVDGHGRPTLRSRRRAGRADDARGRVGVQRRRRLGCGRHRRGGFTVAHGCVGEAFPDTPRSLRTFFFRRRVFFSHRKLSWGIFSHEPDERQFFR